MTNVFKMRISSKNLASSREWKEKEIVHCHFYK